MLFLALAQALHIVGALQIDLGFFRFMLPHPSAESQAFLVALLLLFFFQLILLILVVARGRRGRRMHFGRGFGMV